MGHGHGFHSNAKLPKGNLHQQIYFQNLNKRVHRVPCYIMNWRLSNRIPIANHPMNRPLFSWWGNPSHGATPIVIIHILLGCSPINQPFSGDFSPSLFQPPAPRQRCDQTIASPNRRCSRDSRRPRHGAARLAAMGIPSRILENDGKWWRWNRWIFINFHKHLKFEKQKKIMQTSPFVWET